MLMILLFLLCTLLCWLRGRVREDEDEDEDEGEADLKPKAEDNPGARKVERRKFNWMPFFSPFNRRRFRK